MGNATKKENFDEAVIIITAEFEADGFFHKGATGTRGKRGDFDAGTIAGSLWKPRVHQHMIDAELRATIRAAKGGNYLADRALRLAFKHCVKTGKPMTSVHEVGDGTVIFNHDRLLESYIADVLLEDKGLALASRAGDTRARNSLIVWAISQAVVRTKIFATRNNATEPFSACDAVVQVLVSINRDEAIGFDAVSTIWKNRDEIEFRPSQLWVA